MPPYRRASLRHPKGSAHGTAVALAFAVALVLQAPIARADETDEKAEPAPPVAVWLSSTVGRLAVAIYGRNVAVGEAPPIFQCTTPCSAAIPAGRYRLVVYASEDYLGGGRPIDLRQNTTIVVSPDPQSQRFVGLSLGIAGVAAIAAGLYLVLGNYCVESCRHRDNYAPAGLVALVAGAAMTPIGFSMFGRSFRPDLTIKPYGDFDKGGPTGWIPVDVRAGLSTAF